jgi:hypothetical protein
MEIWENLGIQGVIEEAYMDEEGSAVFESILRKRDSMHGKVADLGLKELIASACWYLWWERRKISRDEQVQKPARSSQAILALSMNYYKASKKNPGIKHHGWQKPAEEFGKLNIDAAFSAENYTGATGAVIRDDGGMFVANSCRGIPHVADAAMAEAIAL